MLQANINRKEGELLKHYLHQLADGFEWKAILSVLGTVVTAVQGFYTDLIWGFLGLFALDLITGIIKSAKNGVPITSKRLRDSVVKLGGYMVLITTLIVLSKYQSDITAMISLAYYYFMFTEAKSILENVQEMGVKLPSFLTSLVNGKLNELDKKEDKGDKKDGDTDQ